MKTKRDRVQMDQDSLNIKSVLEGNTEEFRNIMEKYSGRLYRFILSQGIPPVDAEDLVQDCFFKVFGSLGRFKLGKKFDVWLMGIAVNLIRDFWRKHYRRREMIMDQGSDNQSIFNSIAGNTPEPSEFIITEAERLEVLRSLGTLTADQRLAVSLFYFDDLPVRDVAEATKWSESKVKVLLHRAREKLREYLEDYFSEEML